ncbi:MAG: HAD family hydrolase [Geminicoccales bacterium]
MTRKPSTPRAILFDWDNTLVDNWEVIRQAMNATLEAFGKPAWSLEETRRRVARSARDGFPRLFGDRWQEAQTLFYERFTDRHLEGLRPIAGAEELLEESRNKGFWLAVVSNKRGDLLRAEAAHLGWTGYFGRIVGATDAAEDKPAVAPVELALSGSGLSAGPRVWFVGDGAIDIECARNAGCVAILFNGLQLPAAERAARRPDYCVESHRELAALVRDL